MPHPMTSQRKCERALSTAVAAYAGMHAIGKPVTSILVFVFDEGEGNDAFRSICKRPKRR